MPTLTRRTQILLDEERYAALERAASARGSSVASVIRDAIDDKLREDDDQQRRAQAARALLAAPRPDGREPDWTDVKDDVHDALSRRWQRLRP